MTSQRAAGPAERPAEGNPAEAPARWPPARIVVGCTRCPHTQRVAWSRFESDQVACKQCGGTVVWIGPEPG